MGLGDDKRRDDKVWRGIALPYSMAVWGSYYFDGPKFGFADGPDGVAPRDRILETDLYDFTETILQGQRRVWGLNVMDETTLTCQE